MERKRDRTYHGWEAERRAIRRSAGGARRWVAELWAQLPASKWSPRAVVLLQVVADYARVSAVLAAGRAVTDERHSRSILIARAETGFEPSRFPILSRCNSVFRFQLARVLANPRHLQGAQGKAPRLQQGPWRPQDHPHRQRRSSWRGMLRMRYLPRRQPYRWYSYAFPAMGPTSS
jgi:hypothetical protein